MGLLKLKRIPRTDKSQRIGEILRRLQKEYDGASTELFYRTSYQLLVSVVLSAQTTDKSVNRCMKPLYERGFEPADMLKLGEKGFLRIIRSIGLAATKARNVFRLTQMLEKEFAGNIPDNREDLMRLPGVGPKTSNVVLAELFGRPTLAVDTHVFRVTRRLGLHNEKTPDRCEIALLKIIDRKFLPAAHHWFIRHGRTICFARKPDCPRCFLKDLCLFFKWTLKDGAQTIRKTNNDWT